jgi:hypothetical protein
MKELEPLPQAVITAHKLREQAKTLNLLADELEASVGYHPSTKPGVWPYGEIKWEKRRKRDEKR